MDTLALVALAVGALLLIGAVVEPLGEVGIKVVGTITGILMLVVAGSMTMLPRGGC